MLLTNNILSSKCFGIQSFESYYYSKRKVVYNKSFNESFVSLLRESKKVDFFERSKSLITFFILYKDCNKSVGIPLYIVSFENYKGDKRIYIKKCLNDIKSEGFLAYSISSNSFNKTDRVLSNTELEISNSFCDIIKNFNFISNCTDSKINKLKEIESNFKSFGISNIIYGSNLSLNKRIKYSKFLFDSLSLLNTMNFYDMEKINVSNLNVTIILRPLGNKTIGRYLGNTNSIELNVDKFFDIYSVFITFIHEFSHLRFDRFMNLKLKNNTDLKISFFNSFNNLFNNLKELDGSINKLSCRLESNLKLNKSKKYREYYLLDMDEILARSLEISYFNLFPENIREIILSNSTKESLWYFSIDEQYLLINWYRSNLKNWF